MQTIPRAIVPLDPYHLAISDRNRAEREIGILSLKKNHAELRRDWAEYDRLHFRITYVWGPRRFDAIQRIAANRSTNEGAAA